MKINTFYYTSLYIFLFININLNSIVLFKNHFNILQILIENYFNYDCDSQSQSWVSFKLYKEFKKINSLKNYVEPNNYPADFGGFESNNEKFIL